MASSSSARNASAGPSSAPSPGTNQQDPQTGEKRNPRERSPPDDPTIPKKARQGPKKPAKVPQYHLKKDQIPEGQKGTKDCVFLHGYILYGITRSDSPPPLPTTELLNAFKERYQPGFLAALEDKLRKPSTPHEGASHMVQLLRDQATNDVALGSRIAKNVLRIGDIYLTTIFSGLLSAGFTRWCPDILSPPDTVYNQAHEIIFIQTFKAVASSFAYRILGPIPSGIDNHTLIVDFARSFQYSYMLRKAMTDLKTPGKLEKNKDENNASRRRTRIVEKRLAYAAIDKLPARLCAMFAEPECNSDDESGTDEKGDRVLVVNSKGPRSLSANSFTEKFEFKRVKHVKGVKGKKRSNLTETPRIRDPSRDFESDISFQLPKRAPIDWFAPEIYNDLPAETRYKLAKNGVALPLLEHHDKRDWKIMNKATFMKTYGNDVLKLYDIPTAEEMAEAGNEGWEGESEGEVNDMMDEGNET
ncbi:hypothetical protein C8R43DRAFT_1127808 [Mycena crocata]|nr:hypothetical protein C8R43DRAFT_1127808 [Mycena crocata]